MTTSSKNGRWWDVAKVALGVLNALLLLTVSVLLATWRAQASTTSNDLKALEITVHTNSTCVEVLKAELRHLNQTTAEMRDELRKQSALLEGLRTEARSP